jgi:tetratricopeptide (TPR) repeat protein
MWAILALCFLQGTNPNAEGMKALDLRNYESAAAEFRKAIASDPQDYTAHFNLALACSFLRQDDEGIAEYRKALELKPHLYEAELNAGILMLRRKDPAGAAPLLEDASAQHPMEFRPHYYLAEAQLALERPAEAEKNYGLALAIDPKSAGAELGLARALARQDKLEEAGLHYRQAAALDPQFREWLLELAERYDRNKRLEEAAAIYREFPENSAAQARLGEMLLDRKQYGEAARRLEIAFAKEPSQANRVALAMAYLFDKQLPKALPLMEQAAGAGPSDFDVRMMYARALRDSRQFPAAAAQFAAAAMLRPGDAPAWRELADMLYLTGELERSLAAFEKARDLGEDTPGNCFLRAIILDKMRQLKPALETYERFLAMSQGKNPDQEFQARQRARIIRHELEKR